MALYLKGKTTASLVPALNGHSLIQRDGCLSPFVLPSPQPPMFWSLTNQAGLPIECATCWKWTKRQPLIEYVDQASSFLLSSPALYFTGGLLSGQVWFLNTSHAAVRPFPQQKDCQPFLSGGKINRNMKAASFKLPNQQMDTLPLLFCFLFF